MLKRIIHVIILMLALVFLSGVATAANLSGIVYSQGSPIANLSIVIKENQMKTKTDPKGGYSFQLPPGKYTLIIRGSEITVDVPSTGHKFDINL